jgi:hypothetical protein
MSIEGPTEVQVAGAKAKQFRLKVGDEMLASMGSLPGAADSAQKVMQAMYGKDGLRVTVAPKSGFLVLVLGGDDAYANASVTRAAAGQTPPPSALGNGLAKVAGQNPCFVMRLDVGALMGQVAKLVATAGMPTPSVDQPPFPVEFRGGIAERTWSGGIACDVSDLGRFTRSMKQLEAAKGGPIKARVDLDALDKAVASYMVDNDGKLPDSLDVLAKPDASGESYIAGGKLPLDPWGHAYVYTKTGATYRIASYGSDGKPGGAGDAADIEVTHAISK